MDKPAAFQIETATDRPTAVLTGDWTARRMGPAAQELDRALRGQSDAIIDLTRIGRLDTAGAYAMIRAAGAGFDLDAV